MCKLLILCFCLFLTSVASAATGGSVSGGSATNAIGTVTTNGVTVGTGLTGLNFIGATGQLSGSTAIIGGFGGSGGTPAGNSGAIQFNQGSAFAGTNAFNFNRTNEHLKIGNDAPIYIGPAGISNASSFAFGIGGPYYINMTGPGSEDAQFTPSSSTRPVQIGRSAIQFSKLFVTNIFTKTLNVTDVNVTNGVNYVTSLLTGTGGANTNYTILSTDGHRYINGFTNVSIRGIMGWTAGLIHYPNVNITNGSGSNWTLEFSAVTNRFKSSFGQGSLPSVLTNGTQLKLAFEQDGTNVLVGWAYYSWP